MNKCIYPKSKSRTNGYALMYYAPKGKSIKAHRAVWLLANGAIPENMIVDHICHNEAVAKGKCEGGWNCKHRACVNIKHLRLITQQENVMAGLHNIDNRSHCNQGHLFIKENIMVRKNGKRECAECNRVRARNNWANRKKVNA